MKRKLLMIAFVIATGSMIFVGCKSDEKEEEASNPEFIADDNSFADFASWPLEAENLGPDPALGPAHQGNDSTVTRRVYVKNGQKPVNGLYPVGTLIVKQSTNPNLSVNEITAMAKRGNNYDAEHKNWEYFMLMPDGKIATDGDGNPMRGADLLNGMCVTCHAQAADSDYVFTH